MNSRNFLICISLFLVAQQAAFAAKVANYGSNDKDFNASRTARKLGRIKVNDKKIVNTLLELFKKNPDGFQQLLTFYKDTKNGNAASSLPSVTASMLPTNISSTLASVGLIGDDGKINPKIWESLDMVHTMVTSGISGIKESNCCSKGCCTKASWKACCCCLASWCKTNGPAIAEFTIQNVVPILLQIAMNAAAKKALKSEEEPEINYLQIPEFTPFFRYVIDTTNEYKPYSIEQVLENLSE